MVKGHDSLADGSPAGRPYIRGWTPTQADTCVSTERSSTACQNTARRSLKGLSRAQRRLGRKQSFAGAG